MHLLDTTHKTVIYIYNEETNSSNNKIEVIAFAEDLVIIQGKNNYIIRQSYAKFCYTHSGLLINFYFSF